MPVPCIGTISSDILLWWPVDITVTVTQLAPSRTIRGVMWSHCSSDCQGLGAALLTQVRGGLACGPCAWGTACQALTFQAVLAIACTCY